MRERDGVTKELRLRFAGRSRRSGAAGYDPRGLMRLFQDFSSADLKSPPEPLLPYEAERF
jgi:hypothetical protein